MTAAVVWCTFAFTPSKHERVCTVMLFVPRRDSRQIQLGFQIWSLWLTVHIVLYKRPDWISLFRQGWSFAVITTAVVIVTTPARASLHAELSAQWLTASCRSVVWVKAWMPSRFSRRRCSCWHVNSWPWKWWIVAVVHTRETVSQVQTEYYATALQAHVTYRGKEKKKKKCLNISFILLNVW